MTSPRSLSASRTTGGRFSCSSSSTTLCLSALASALACLYSGVFSASTAWLCASSFCLTMPSIWDFVYLPFAPAGFTPSRSALVMPLRTAYSPVVFLAKLSRLRGAVASRGVLPPSREIY